MPVQQIFLLENQKWNVSTFRRNKELWSTEMSVKLNRIVLICFRIDGIVVFLLHMRT